VGEGVATSENEEVAISKAKILLLLPREIKRVLPFELNELKV
jgi:hypothetical protein